MARRKRANSDQPIGVGLTTKQMKRKNPLNADYLVNIEPLNDNQKKLFSSYKSGKHIVAYGLSILANEQLMASKYAEEAIKKYNIDPRDYLNLQSKRLIQILYLNRNHRNC